MCATANDTWGLHIQHSIPAILPPDRVEPCRSWLTHVKTFLKQWVRGGERSRTFSPSLLKISTCARAGAPVETNPILRLAGLSSSCFLMICDHAADGQSNGHCPRGPDGHVRSSSWTFVGCMDVAGFLILLLQQHPTPSTTTPSCGSSNRPTTFLKVCRCERNSISECNQRSDCNQSSGVTFTAQCCSDWPCMDAANRMQLPP